MWPKWPVNNFYVRKAKHLLCFIVIYHTEPIMHDPKVSDDHQEPHPFVLARMELGKGLSECYLDNNLSPFQQYMSFVQNSNIFLYKGQKTYISLKILDTPAV